MAVDRAGNLFVTEASHNHIVKFGPKESSGDGQSMTGTGTVIVTVDAGVAQDAAEKMNDVRLVFFA